MADPVTPAPPTSSWQPPASGFQNNGGTSHQMPTPTYPQLTPPIQPSTFTASPYTAASAPTVSLIKPKQDDSPPQPTYSLFYGPPSNTSSENELPLPCNHSSITSPTSMTSTQTSSGNAPPPDEPKGYSLPARFCFYLATLYVGYKTFINRPFTFSASLTLGGSSAFLAILALRQIWWKYEKTLLSKTSDLCSKRKYLLWRMSALAITLYAHYSFFRMLPRRTTVVTGVVLGVYLSDLMTVKSIRALKQIFKTDP